MHDMPVRRGFQQLLDCSTLFQVTKRNIQKSTTTCQPRFRRFGRWRYDSVLYARSTLRHCAGEQGHCVQAGSYYLTSVSFATLNPKRATSGKLLINPINRASVCSSATSTPAPSKKQPVSANSHIPAWIPQALARMKLLHSRSAYVRMVS
jgi:hypothetical protein